MVIQTSFNWGLSTWVRKLSQQTIRTWVPPKGWDYKARKPFTPSWPRYMLSDLISIRVLCSWKSWLWKWSMNTFGNISCVSTLSAPLESVGFLSISSHHEQAPRRKDDALISVWSYVRYFVVGAYVGCAVVGIFMYWYIFDVAEDGHTLVTLDQLLTWGSCQEWKGFTVNDVGGFSFLVWRPWKMGTFPTSIQKNRRPWEYTPMSIKCYLSLNIITCIWKLITCTKILRAFDATRW